MIKESKYIIRKIIIGVGIALCLAFLNGCKVKALGGNVNFTSSSNKQNYYLNNSDYHQLCRYNRGLSQYPQLDYYVFIDANSENIIFANTLYSAIVPLNQNAFSESGIDSMLCLNSTTNNGSFYNGGQGLWFINKNSIDKIYMLNTNVPYSFRILFNNSSSSPIFANLQFTQSDGQPDVYFNDVLNAGSYRDFSAGNDITNINDYVSYTSYDIYENSNSNVIYKDSNTMISSPEFISFNASKTVHNNLLLGYTFAPEFSVFDTENYEYQYRIGLNDIWLTMNENLYEFNVNANTTVYVRIKDKSNNELIDSSTFTITGIGNFVDTNVDYDIKFNGKYRTQNYLNNNSSGSSIIQEYEIDVTFSPESSILKYQYQYVLNGNLIDNNGWIDVSLQPSNMGNFTTVVSQNGTLYARILDSSDNIMATGSFTINSIGKIAFDNSNDKILNKYNNIANSINFAGPISGLIDIPIKVIGTITTGLVGGLTCSDYQLGRLMGTNLVIPCVNVKARLGESLYMTIDIILSACMAYHIIKMIFDLYNNLVFMEKNPVVDLGRRRS